MLKSEYAGNDARKQCLFFDSIHHYLNYAPAAHFFSAHTPTQIPFILLHFVFDHFYHLGHILKYTYAPAHP